MNKKILLIGGGGHCKSVLDSLLNLNEYADIGIIDNKENAAKTVLGIPILGCDKNLPSLYKDGYSHAFVTVGSIGNPSLRIKLFNALCEIGFIIPNIVDASSEVSKYARIGKGVFIGKQAIVNAGAVICDGTIINSGAIVEHDCEIGEFVHIAPGTVLSGGVKIGDHSHIGSNTTVKQGICIGSNCVIGMGSIVTKNIRDNVMAYGNPCKEVKKL
ncbi:acetyltransferase [Acetivibrio mesophilus]|uniref:Acetyltransferase n=1 Tax=Acetivibrio mesophilus TaxID=2487273 RepID=A0A4Q0I518_9FIRM|nr:acetyltransferase [Acetivibrio mesophilus]ODM27450.1 serine acetyltransferase [Clostridium sp. Bc-iso-3]RXE59410.1 acetyltransferase [Acetivibrio mesophilus]HHV30193.1 acetyltransferase [Clostridium sp.]